MIEDRTKACIDDLEQQIAWIRDNDFHKFHGWGDAVLAMRDAAALLKAQEPRVMTLEEVKSLPCDDEDNAPVWMETRVATDRGVLTYLEAGILWTIEGDSWRCFRPIRSGWGDVKSGYYDVTWRCWTSRPTDEQRKAAEWHIETPV